MTAPRPTMTLGAAALADRTGGAWVAPPDAVSATSVEIDSRRCRDGSLFLALPGTQVDGHDYIDAAAANGAVAAMVSRRVENAPLPLLLVDDVEAGLARLGATGREAHAATGGRLVGITGSVGKTGSKEMLARLLAPTGCHASRASFNNHLGVPLTLAALPATPVDAIQEMGMNAPGEISTLSRLARPDIAVITRIADSHAGFFDSLDQIADAKAEIFDGLRAGGTAILNRDDPYFGRRAAQANSAGAGAVVGFGTSEEADIRLLRIERTTHGMRVGCRLEDSEFEFTLGMQGAHWAMNAMAMLAAVRALGHDAVSAAGHLADFTNLPGRGAVLSGSFAGADITLVDDSYNAGPASMKAAFAGLAATPPQVMVLSEMLELGDGTTAAHAALASGIISLRPRLVITIGPEMSRMASALPCATNHYEAATADDAIARLREQIRGGDIVFVKGSNGSGAWRVAAAMIASLQAGPSPEAGETHDAA